MEKYLWAARLSVTVEMHGHAINDINTLINSIIYCVIIEGFIISVCLLIEKAIKLDNVTFSMPYIQLYTA